MYGAPAAQLPAAQPQRMTVGVRPPPVGQVRDIDDEDVPPARPSPRPAQAAPPPPAAAGGSDGNGNGRRTGFIVPFGRAKGEDLAEVDDENLVFLQGYFTKALGDPAKSRYREGNQEGLDAVNAEIAFREGGDNREPGDDR